MAAVRVLGKVPASASINAWSMLQKSVPPPPSGVQRQVLLFTDAAALCRLVLTSVTSQASCGCPKEQLELALSDTLPVAWIQEKDFVQRSLTGKRGGILKSSSCCNAVLKGNIVTLCFAKAKAHDCGALTPALERNETPMQVSRLQRSLGGPSNRSHPFQREWKIGDEMLA